MQQRVPRQWPGRQLFWRTTTESSDLQNGRPAVGAVVHSLEQACQYLAFDRRVALGGWIGAEEASFKMGPATMQARLHVEPISEFAMARLTFSCGMDFVASITTTSSFPGAIPIVDYVQGGDTSTGAKGLAIDTSPFRIGTTPPAAAAPYTVDIEIVVQYLQGAGWSLYCTGVQFFALPLSGIYNAEGGTVNAG